MPAPFLAVGENVAAPVVGLVTKTTLPQLALMIFEIVLQLADGQENEAFATRKGKPVDKFDRHCQNWSRCYRCAVIDSTEDEKCDPMKQEYFVDFR